MVTPCTRRSLLAALVAPLACALPLLPWMARPGSDLFLGALLGEPAMTPWFAAEAVLIDGTIVGFVFEATLALPVYALARRFLMPSAPLILFIGAFSGVVASVFVGQMQEFPQPALAEFAASPTAHLLGALGGVTSGAIFWGIVRRRSMHE